MKIAISFTDLFISMSKGLVKIEDFNQFIFGCARVHVLCSPEFAPHETTWVQKKSINGSQVVDLDQLEPTTLQTWFKFKATILHADSQGRVTWDCCREGRWSRGGYPNIKDALVAEGHEVFYWGEWHDKKSARCMFCGSSEGVSMEVAGDWPRCVNCHGC